MPDKQDIQIAHFHFNLPLKRHELPLWRRAYLGMLPSALAIHQLSISESVYPLVQFCRFGKQAGILAINEGISAVRETVYAQSWAFRWQQKAYELGITQIDTFNHTFAYLPKPKLYRIEAYLPASSTGIESREESTSSLIQQVQELQSSINTHAQILLNCLNIDVEDPINLQLTHLDRSKWWTQGKSKNKVYDLRFLSPLHWPSGIGIGEEVHSGLGRLVS